MIGAQLRSVTEIAPKSPFPYLNRSHSRYGFRAGAKTTRYSVNIAFERLSLSVVTCATSRTYFARNANARGGGGDSHMKQTGMHVRNFEFNP